MPPAFEFPTTESIAETDPTSPVASALADNLERSPTPLRRQRLWPRLIGLVIVLGLIGTATWYLHDLASPEYLAAQEVTVRQFVQAQWGLAWVLAFLIAFGLCLLPSGPLKMILLAIAGGWLFGFIPGMILASFATAAAACTISAISRYLVSDLVERVIGRRLDWLHEAIAKDGGHYLLLYRLVPGAPFSPVNWALGLTKLPLRTCWTATQLGLLPQMMLFAYTGSQLPSLQTILDDGVFSLLTPQLVASAVAILVVPLFLRWLVVAARVRIAER